MTKIRTTPLFFKIDLLLVQFSQINEKLLLRPFYSFFFSPYLPSILEVERTSVALNADDVR